MKIETTIIISGGDIVDEEVKEIIYQASQKGSLFLIAADRGMECCMRLNLQPNIVVGDFDSISTGAYHNMLWYLKKYEIPCQTLAVRKNETDTEAALHIALEQRKSGDIILLGGTGFRIDHMLANIAILGQGAKLGRKIYLQDSHNRVSMLFESVVLKKNQLFGNYISLLPYAGIVTHVTLDGFSFPLTDVTLDKFSSLGISNVLIEEEGQISFEDGILICVEAKE